MLQWYSGSITTAVINVALVGVGLYILRRLSSRVRLPPGPPRLPLLGNVLNWPRSHEWETFTKWSHQYGDIVYTQVLGQSVVILNSPQAVADLLEKRASTTSERPIRTMFHLSGMSQGLVGAPYDGRLRRLRTLVAKTIGTKAGVARFVDLAEAETHRFLWRVINTPSTLEAQIRRTAASIMLDIAYGYQITEDDDALVKLINLAMARLSKISTQVFLVDAVPFLRFLPEWFPGASFHRIAREAKQHMDGIRDVPFKFTKAQLAAGTARPSFVAQHLEDPEYVSSDDPLIQTSATALYGGGSDTTVSAIHTFFLAMTLYPDVQRRAQAEIDAVVGPDRLPTLADRESLPYTVALVKELFRWRPPTPMVAPHRLTEDDVYNNYFIPKNTLLIPNAWKVLHDPETFQDPFAFDPARFTGPDAELDLSHFAFGFGKRICPGITLADTTIFLSVVMSLATLNVSKAKDAQGREIEPRLDYTSGGIISHPKAFPCVLKPRSAKAEALVATAEHLGSL